MTRARVDRSVHDDGCRPVRLHGGQTPTRSTRARPPIGVGLAPRSNQNEQQPAPDRESRTVGRQRVGSSAARATWPQVRPLRSHAATGLRLAPCIRRIRRLPRDPPGVSLLGVGHGRRPSGCDARYTRQRMGGHRTLRSRSPHPRLQRRATRVIVEKPFGRGLPSARRLEATIHIHGAR